MTTLEIAHSLTKPEIAARVTQMAPKLAEITDFTFSHRSKLIRPMISYDTAALALSFVPAAGEMPAKPEPYTYHHLRRDLYNLCCTTGVSIDSRYIVPSAHLTIGRFITQDDFTHSHHGHRVVDPEKVRRWVSEIEEINEWLRKTFWLSEESETDSDWGWSIGQEKGLDCCQGTLWYGNGETVRLGKGF